MTVKWVDRDWISVLSPRPWRINLAWEAQKAGVGNVHAVTEPPILDANGDAVMSTSEWLEISREDVELIVIAVNAHDA